MLWTVKSQSSHCASLAVDTWHIFFNLRILSPCRHDFRDTNCSRMLWKTISWMNFWKRSIRLKDEVMFTQDISLLNYSTGAVWMSDMSCNLLYSASLFGSLSQMLGFFSIFLSIRAFIFSVANFWIDSDFLDCLFVL